PFPLFPPRPPPTSSLLPSTPLFRSSPTPSSRTRGLGGLGDRLPALWPLGAQRLSGDVRGAGAARASGRDGGIGDGAGGLHGCLRSAEHTSELQSRENLVCRLLLERK